MLGLLKIPNACAKFGRHGEAQEIRVRGFMHANAEGENVYAPVHIVARVPDLRDQIEQRLKLEIRSWQARAREFSLFGEVVAAIDALDQPNPTSS